MTRFYCPFFRGKSNTVVSRIYGHFSGKGSSTEMRLLLIVGLVIFVHVAVKILRHGSEWIILKRKSHQKNHPLIFRTRQPKFITISRLVVSAIIFILYFFAFGLILVRGRKGPFRRFNKEADREQSLPGQSQARVPPVRG
jgi:magnesium-transporting ATPase (P-type)